MTHFATTLSQSAFAKWLRRVWPVLKHILTLAFLLAVIVLIAIYLRDVEWGKVAASLRAQSGMALGLAAALTATSYLVYTCYDLLGRIYVRHQLPRLRVMATAFVSYAFNLNLGTMIGGIGFRYRLYSRAGLGSARITRILGLSIVTNWLGYLCLAGVVFVLRFTPLPPAWGIGMLALQLAGALLLVIALAYLLFAAFSKRRKITVRSTDIHLPSLPVTLMQFSLSIVNWLLIATVLYVLLRQEIPFQTVLAVLLLSAIAGVIARIPGGLGVIETVFLLCLGGMMPRAELLATLLVYRAIYYLAPFLLGIAVYFALETKGRHKKPTGSARKTAAS